MDWEIYPYMVRPPIKCRTAQCTESKVSFVVLIHIFTFLQLESTGAISVSTHVSLVIKTFLSPFFFNSYFSYNIWNIYFLPVSVMLRILRRCLSASSSVIVHWRLYLWALIFEHSPRCKKKNILFCHFIFQDIPPQKMASRVEEATYSSVSMFPYQRARSDFL